MLPTSSKTMLAAASAALLLGAAVSTLHAAAFTAGDIVVSRVGDGSAALTSAATATFLDEYTPAGTLVQSIPLPTAASGSNLILTNSGTATSEAFLQMSPDGTKIAIAGYNTAPGTASITGSTSISRVVGLIALDGSIDTTTSLSVTSNVGNPRSAIANGSTVYLATSAGGVNAITAGTATPFATGASGTQLSTTPLNTRVVGIANGQLYVSSASGAFQGVCTIGSGLPTTAGQTTTILPGFPTASGPSNYDYVFEDPNTLFVADDRTATGGGIEKWTLAGGTWTNVYTIQPTGVGFRGLAGFAAPGGFQMYATGTSAAGTSVYSILDTGTLAGAVASPIVTAAPTNTAFRGVEIIPGSSVAVPEPATLSLVGLAGLALAIRRRR